MRVFQLIGLILMAVLPGLRSHASEHDPLVEEPVCRSLRDRLQGDRAFAKCLSNELSHGSLQSWVSFGAWSYSGFPGQESRPALKLEVFVEEGTRDRFLKRTLVIEPRHGRFSQEAWRICPPFQFKEGIGGIPEGVASFNPSRVSLIITNRAGVRLSLPRGLQSCLKHLEQ